MRVSSNSTMAVITFRGHMSMPTTHCCSFFFSRYGDHRDLHSFPTRRSSDLEDQRHALLDPGPALLRRLAGALVEQNADRDRKSTRLNSSHSQSSYAVFCL